MLKVNKEIISCLFYPTVLGMTQLFKEIVLNFQGYWNQTLVFANMLSFTGKVFFYHRLCIISKFLFELRHITYIITHGTTSQRLGSISFFFFLHVAISDLVQWLPYLGFVPGPTCTRSKGLMSLLLVLADESLQLSLVHHRWIYGARGKKWN